MSIPNLEGVNNVNLVILAPFFSEQVRMAGELSFLTIPVVEVVEAAEGDVAVVVLT